MAQTGKKSKPAPTTSRTRQERSAGVLLFRGTAQARLFLLLDYGRYWDYPKGHVEKGESDETAARRELAEETGITDIEILPGFQHEIVYFFRHPRGGPVRKTVVFFLARTETTAVQLSEEHVGYEWLPEDQAQKRLKYPTARQLFQAAVRFLSQGTGQRQGSL